MHNNRKQLFSAAAVFAIAMVVGAWTTSTREEEDGTLSINLMINGYDVESGIPDAEPGAFCLFHVAASGGNPPYEVEWWGDVFTYSGSSLNEDETLPGSEGVVWQYVAVQAAAGSDNDYIFFDLDDAADGCPSP